MSQKKKVNKTSAPIHIKNIKGMVIILLSVLTILESGFIGVVLLSIADFLVGEAKVFAAIFLILYGAFYAGIYRYRTQALFMQTKFGVVLSMIFLELFLLISQQALNGLEFTSFGEYMRNLITTNQVPDAGITGYVIVGGLEFLIGDIGMNMIMIALLIIIIIFIIDFEDVKYSILEVFQRFNTKSPKNSTNHRINPKGNKTESKSQAYNVRGESKKAVKKDITTKFKEKKDLITHIKVGTNTKEKQKVVQQEPKVTKVNNRDYKIPSIEILKSYGADNQKKEAQIKKIASEKSAILVETLSQFKLDVEIIGIVVGPNVTRFELKPGTGVKINKFNSISNDIALSLAAKAVRIEAPIPGKAAIGIEIPNEETMMVGLKDVLTSVKNDNTKNLQVGLGKDIYNESRFIEINKTPHMLIAGSTGSGKSVCINGIIISILTKASPEDVKLIMIDPKKVELAPFNGIPHLSTPVVTEPKKAAAILKKMVIEMEYRYELFAKTNTRNIEGYNKVVREDKTYTFKKLPYIVIIIDELADLMMVASKDVEDSIVRLTQMARAAGMHLIVATQRPSTDVITGLIKANIPTRIAFSVSSSIDSRTILDATGAEKLLGRGDMLISEQSSNNLVRIQGAFIDDDEVIQIVNEITRQFDQSDINDSYDQELTNIVENDNYEDDELDEYYEQVKNEVIYMQKASASHIQRRYNVGFNRALRILDQLETNGIIAASEGTKPRKVLVSEADINENYK